MEQPIPPEKIAAFYVESLELQIEAMGVQESQRLVQAKIANLNDRLSDLWKAHGVNPAEWQIDLKTGVMTTKVS